MQNSVSFWFKFVLFQDVELHYMFNEQFYELLCYVPVWNVFAQLEGAYFVCLLLTYWSSLYISIIRFFWPYCQLVESYFPDSRIETQWALSRRGLTAGPLREFLDNKSFVRYMYYRHFFHACHSVPFKILIVSFGWGWV